MRRADLYPWTCLSPGRSALTTLCPRSRANRTLNAASPGPPAQVSPRQCSQNGSPAAPRWHSRASPRKGRTSPTGGVARMSRPGRTAPDRRTFPNCPTRRTRRTRRTLRRPDLPSHSLSRCLHPRATTRPRPAVPSARAPDVPTADVLSPAQPPPPPERPVPSAARSSGDPVVHPGARRPGQFGQCGTNCAPQAGDGQPTRGVTERRVTASSPGCPGSLGFQV